MKCGKTFSASVVLALALTLPAAARMERIVSINPCLDTILVNIADAVSAAVPVANPADVPESWPGDRFDVIWRFDLDEQTGIWTFSALDQQLLAGDLAPSAPDA